MPFLSLAGCLESRERVNGAGYRLSWSCRSKGEKQPVARRAEGADQQRVVSGTVILATSATRRGSIDGAHDLHTIRMTMISGSFVVLNLT